MLVEERDAGVAMMNAATYFAEMSGIFFRTISYLFVGCNVII
jgi:hypothetical protein